MDQHLICVRNGKKKTYRYRLRLQSFGLFYNGHCFTMNTDDIFLIKKIRNFCRVHGLQFNDKNLSYTRNTSYRREYFSHYKPAVFQRYFCIYCGRLIPCKQITVDHIIPVKKASENPVYQNFVRALGWRGINDYHNLGAACRKCNSKKSSKTGMWLIRGFVGKSNLFQIVRWFIRILVPAVFVVLIVHLT